MRKRHIALIVVLVFIIVLAGIFVYERLQASLYMNDDETMSEIACGVDNQTMTFFCK